ncbi:hypothetical protein JCM8547_004330 [Rhodosporidiobolus lusitaniae]
MDERTRNGLTNGHYETRKRAALAYEPYLRDLVNTGTNESEAKLRVIITQLCDMAMRRDNSVAARSGGAMGLASLAIALGPRLPDYLGPIMLPVLACFEDTEQKLRYFACESLYNIAKVAQGELLVYFNEMFDMLSKLHADPEKSVKNGAELLDRLLKDIVTEQASTYVSIANYGPEEEQDPAAASFPSTAPVFHDERHGPPRSVSPSSSHSGEDDQGLVNGIREAQSRASPPSPAAPAQPQRAFSLPRFIPLLRERMTVQNSYTRSFLISWLDTLDSVPELELISYLPDFLEGLMLYLNDGAGEVSYAASALLVRFLGEIKEVREVELQRLVVKREGWEKEVRRRNRVRRPSEAKTVTEGGSGREDGSAEGGGEGTPVPRREREASGDSFARDENEDAIASSDEEDYEDYDEDDGEWAPGQGVHIDYTRIVDLLVKNLSFPDEEVQGTCLDWLYEFLQFAPGVLVPFAPRLIPVILSALAHPAPSIQQAAVNTNDALFAVIQGLPVDSPPSLLSPTSPNGFSPPQPSTAVFAAHERGHTASPAPAPSNIPFPSSSTSATPRPGHDRHKPGSDASISLLQHQSSISTLPSIASATSSSLSTSFAPDPHPSHSHAQPHHPFSRLSLTSPSPSHSEGEEAVTLAYPHELQDPLEPDGLRFAYGATVNELTLQFLSESEETRVAALEWLTMLHQKAPRKILAGDDSISSSTRSRPVPSQDSSRQNTSSTARQRNPSASSTSSGLSIALLLKMLSDPSERVLRYDLQLLAQIATTTTSPSPFPSQNPSSPPSYNSHHPQPPPPPEEDYFPALMSSLLELFSTDRKLLETRGSLVIRNLCEFLNAERIYRTCAEILERDEDLDFASIMVQNLNLIMITSPEFSDFRKRLRTLDTKDGQNLFVTLYRSWSHNAVATFTLCLLAQAYEQACALLQIFADLEMTVSLLVQIDKLVQLLESPVFTSLRLQLLEPDRHPYLLKAMYGLLMLLPQSSAFTTLRNRLNVVGSLGYMGTVPRASFVSPTPSTSLRSTSSLVSTASSSASSAGGSLSRRTTADGGTSTPDPQGIRWGELLSHFRGVQKRRAGSGSGGAGGDGGGGGGAATVVSPRAITATGGGTGGEGQGGGAEGPSPPTASSSTFGSRILGRGGVGGGGNGPRKVFPSFGVVGGGGNASFSTLTSNAGSRVASGRPPPPSASSSNAAQAQQRAVSPTLAAAQKRRVGSAPSVKSAGGGGAGGEDGVRRT